MGAGVLNLNGTGLAAFPGAIRVDLAGVIIPKPVVLESFSSINLPGSANSLTLQGAISGPGGLREHSFLAAITAMLAGPKSRRGHSPLARLPRILEPGRLRLTE